MIVFCICCEKELNIDEHDCIYEGGTMKISFGYGSRNDQVKVSSAEDIAQSLYGFSLNNKLLADELESYLCDDCFDKKKHLIRSFEVTTSVSRKEIK